MRKPRPMLMTRILILSFFLSGCAVEFAAVSGGLNTAYNAYKELKELQEEKIEEEVQRRLENKLSEGKRQEGVLLKGYEVPR